MKKISSLIILTLLLAACENENLPNPEYTGKSKVISVSYPEITLIGSPLIYMHTGGTFVDSGATVFDDVTGNTFTLMATSSELDVNTEGLYSVDYTFKNGNGFTTSIFRTVLVLDYTPPAGLDPNYDISGNYLRAATGVICVITKVDNGLYVTDHVGGSTPVPAYFVTPDETSFDIPPQTTFNHLDLEGIDEVFTPGPPTKLQYKVIASGFGTGNRVFEKQ